MGWCLLGNSITLLRSGMVQKGWCLKLMNLAWGNGKGVWVSEIQVLQAFCPGESSKAGDGALSRLCRGTRTSDSSETLDQPMGVACERGNPMSSVPRQWGSPRTHQQQSETCTGRCVQRKAFGWLPSSPCFRQGCSLRRESDHQTHSTPTALKHLSQLRIKTAHAITHYMSISPARPHSHAMWYAQIAPLGLANSRCPISVYGASG